MIKIKINIDYEKINSFKQFMIKKVIVKRAYKGYVWWTENGGATPLIFSEFNSFEFWKIEMSFRIYFKKFRNGIFNKSYLNFKGIVLNQS
jgi:hypothetical protein